MHARKVVRGGKGHADGGSVPTVAARGSDERCGGRRRRGVVGHRVVDHGRRLAGEAAPVSGCTGVKADGHQTVARHAGDRHVEGDLIAGVEGCRQWTGGRRTGEVDFVGGETPDHLAEDHGKMNRADIGWVVLADGLTDRRGRRRRVGIAGEGCKNHVVAGAADIGDLEVIASDVDGGAFRKAGERA